MECPFCHRGQQLARTELAVSWPCGTRISEPFRAYMACYPGAYPVDGAGVCGEGRKLYRWRALSCGAKALAAQWDRLFPGFLEELLAE